MARCASAMGGGRPRTKSNPRSNSGRSVTYVRRQCSTLASTRDRQPLGSSPNHAHATEDNTPCWGESAVATRVLTQWLYLGLRMHSPPNRRTTRTRAAASSNYSTGLNPVVVPHTTGLNPVVVPHTTGLNHDCDTRRGCDTWKSNCPSSNVREVAGRLRVTTRYFPPRFVPRLTPVFLPHGY